MITLYTEVENESMPKHQEVASTVGEMEVMPDLVDCGAKKTSIDVIVETTTHLFSHIIFMFFLWCLLCTIIFCFLIQCYVFSFEVILLKILLAF